jgi:hypothetical protein
MNSPKLGKKVHTFFFASFRPSFPPGENSIALYLFVLLLYFQEFGPY